LLSTFTLTSTIIKNEKKLTGLLVVAFCGVQMPAQATNYNTWTGLNNAMNASGLDFGLIPIGMNNDISAPHGAGPLTNWSVGNLNFYPNGYTLTGSGGNNAVFHNEQNCILSIWGEGTIDSNGSTTQTITNNGNLTLNDLVLTNGVSQTQSGAQLNIGIEEGNNQGGSVRLSGNNNITAGEVGINGMNAKLVFDGGTLGKGAYINITGPQNKFEIRSGNVTLNDSALSNQAHNTNADLWEAGAYYSLTGGTLTFDKFIHNTASGNGAYSQSGGTLNLINGSSLNLNTYWITTYGSGSGVSTVNIGADSGTDTSVASSFCEHGCSNLEALVFIDSTSGADTSSLTVTSGVVLSTAAAGDTLTINIGNGSTGNSLNIAGGVLDESATVVLNANNTLNISSGTVTLNETGVGIDTLIGAVTLSGGDLYLDSVVSHGAFTQTGGNIHIVNASGYATINQITGVTQISADSILTVDDASHFVGGSLINHGTLNLSTTTGQIFGASLSGSGTVNKTGAGEYTVLAGSHGMFGYTLHINQGAWTVVTDTGTTANFNAPVTVDSSALTVSAASTHFNNGLTLSHGYLGILRGGFGVTGDLSVGSTVNTMNGVVATNTITEDLNIGPSGTAEFLVDFSPSTGTSDDYKIGGAITSSGATGTIQVSDFKVVGAPTDLQTIDFKVFDATLGISPGIDFTSTNSIVKSTASMYSLSASPLQNGSYTLDWQGYNPEAFRGQVATEAAYVNQLTTHNVLFDHVGLVSQQLPSAEKTSVWVKGYGNIEKLELSQGINTQNNSWGSLLGVDFPLVQLENGWNFLPTAYLGYAGGYQDYSGVNMRQNGGQGGIMGTFYNGHFTTSFLANVGGYGNNMTVEGAKDSPDNWFVGGASKSSYDIELPNYFVLQPNILVSYNAFGSQNWDSSYGSTSMTTDGLNGLNLAPGLNLILNKKTWSVYATTQLMVNDMDGIDGTVGDVNLPMVEMGSTSLHCGLGGTNQINDRLSLYGQIGFTDGVENGVDFQGGVRWEF
jgi:hypothetical protein